MTDSGLERDIVGDEDDLEDLGGGFDGTEGTSLALFPGDDGGLSLAQREALVSLLKHRYISPSTYPEHWRTLIGASALIKSRLNDMFLDLHLDTTRQVAFKRQAKPEGGGSYPTLLHDLAYTREETILLAFLRHRFQSEQSAGTEQVYIERADLLDQVTRFRPATATDQAGNLRATENAIDSLIKAKLLLRTREDERLRISPVIAVLLPLERLAELHEWLIAANGSEESA